VLEVAAFDRHVESVAYRATFVSFGYSLLDYLVAWDGRAVVVAPEVLPRLVVDVSKRV